MAVPSLSKIRVSASMFLLPPPRIAADGGAATLAGANAVV